MGIMYRLVTSDFFQRTGLARGMNTWLGRMADRRVPGWLLRMVIRKYIRMNTIDMADFEDDLNKYATFNQFFTRKLSPGCRPLGEGITAPADGVVTAAGAFSASQLFHVKGSDYPLEELLGKPGFDSGSFATIYLSPADYHRVHAPLDGTVTAIRHLDGAVRTVNPTQLYKHPQLYCTNERVVLEGESDTGKFFLILVGALVVGRIGISLVEDFSKGFSGENLSIPIAKGDEIGLFELGSTVILIMDSASLTDAEKRTGNHIKMGEPLC
jgi:phosphatidylserine decarboxylase